MLKFIIRLDDACPNMDEEKWCRMEELLDRYDVKPIVGIIPDCKDKELLKYKKIEDFWNKYALNWQNKKWIIAQHGLEHNLNKKVRTEYAGHSYEEQKENFEKGNKILKSNNINPVCFFAPAHTFDDTTVKVCNDLKYFSFISDGVALYPYKYKDMLFLPNIFDTPHKILPFGIYTFVFHPNGMQESDFNYLEEFIEKYKDNFDIDLDEILEKYKNRKKNLLDNLILLSINVLRKIKGTQKGKEIKDE